jgi:hypothetical protein
MAQGCRLARRSKVVSNLGYTGRDGSHLSEAAPDPEQPFGNLPASWEAIRRAGPVAPPPEVARSPCVAGTLSEQRELPEFVALSHMGIVAASG